MARKALLAGLALLWFAFTLETAARASQQLLQNGGFEGGTSSWTGAGIAVSGCDPRSGALALSLTATAGDPARAQQAVLGVAAGFGPYTLGGYAKRAAGSPSASVLLRFLDPGGREVGEQEAPLALGSAYAPFGVVFAAAPEEAVSALVRISVSGNAGVCVDDVSLDGPSPVTATPSSTPAPSSTPTPLPSPTSTRVAATSTPSPLGSTPAASATPGGGASGGQSGAVPPAVTVHFELVNGGFESGIEPWAKFGGELQLVSSPVRSGNQAAAFSSATSSTKWAYQTVRTTPGQAYEFAGFVHVGPGTAQSYLRVSWYESADGSGTSIGNVDSTARLSGPTSAFVHLTSGPIAPPPGANSARLRAMLTPAGSAPAVIYFDDFYFGPSTAPATAIAAAAPALEEEAAEPPDSPAAPAGEGALQSGGPSEPRAEPPPASAAVAAARAVKGQVETEPPQQGERPTGTGSDPGLVAAMGGVMAAVGLGFALWHTRRTAADR